MRRGGEGGTRLEAWCLSAGTGEWGGERPKGVYELCMREQACTKLAFAHLNLLHLPPRHACLQLACTVTVRPIRAYECTLDPKRSVLAAST